MAWDFRKTSENLGRAAPVEALSRPVIDLDFDCGEIGCGVDGQVGSFREVLAQQWSGPRKSDTKSKDPSYGSSQMYSRNTLSHSDAVSAIELFEQGFTAKSVSMSLNLAGAPVQMLYQRWQLRGAGALMTGERRQYDFGTKLEIVLAISRVNPGGFCAKSSTFPHPALSRIGRASIGEMEKTGCARSTVAGHQPLAGIPAQKARPRRCVERTNGCALRSPTWESCVP